MREREYGVSCCMSWIVIILKLLECYRFVDVYRELYCVLLPCFIYNESTCRQIY